MKQYLFLLLTASFLLACNQTPKQADGQQPAATNSGSGGLRFSFSKQAPGTASSNDWCHLSLPEAALISADPANSNRRLFTLSEGPHRVTVDFGNIVASFVLKKTGNLVEIFNSDNFPECLSNSTNFKLGADGQTFNYDNQKHIQFEMQLVPLPNGTQVALEMAPGAGYGIIVRR